jgi:hypothetical protein
MLICLQTSAARSDQAQREAGSDRWQVFPQWSGCVGAPETRGLRLAQHVVHYHQRFGEICCFHLHGKTASRVGERRPEEHVHKARRRFLCVSTRATPLPSKPLPLSPTQSTKYIQHSKTWHKTWGLDGSVDIAMGYKGSVIGMGSSLLVAPPTYHPSRQARRSKVEVALRLTVSQPVSQSVCLGIEHPCGTCDQILLAVGRLLSEICGLLSAGRPLRRENGSALCSVISRWSESRRTRNHTLLSHLRLPEPGGPSPRALGSLYVVSYDSTLLAPQRSTHIARTRTLTGPASEPMGGRAVRREDACRTACSTRLCTLNKEI